MVGLGFDYFSRFLSFGKRNQANQSSVGRMENGVAHVLQQSKKSCETFRLD